MGQPQIPPTPPGTSLAGKTIIITGGNAGLGFEAARQFLILKASRVIIAVRSKSKGQEAVSALRANLEVKKANPHATIQAFELDLDDYESGLLFAEKVKTEVKELDVLLCNGGVNLMDYQKSKSGHERVMQALELLPLLQATAAIRGTPSHLTIVGSATQTTHTLTKKPVIASGTVFDHFDNQKTYSGVTRYSDSKLTANAFVRALFRHVPTSDVIVNNLCPGLVATGFDKHLSGWLKPIMFVYRKVAARNVEEGGRTLVYAATLAGSETHGQFLQHNKIDQGASFLDQEAGSNFIEKLWAEMVGEATKIDPKLKKYVYPRQAVI
ncbi:Uncharacterized protein BP5553_10628 [Venustampulla echinocandica]|uniref:NAD(P)-binding protein n=1 Tax=Venustampulla echinocandica TaxID=2656787 RepID=A0A370T941_9HELO|nr:Uncharacterized protein BP5553_10628 [Venustampulla echinocandica]RDL30001.1 Uncharacterized protein BP5553_10628 [Venustampulla echinocandica]